VVHVNFDGDSDAWADGRHSRARAAYVQPAPGELAATDYAETGVRVIHAAAVVEVIAEDGRSGVSVAISNPGRAPMPTVERRNGRIEIDGRLSRRIDDCLEGGGAELDGYGTLAQTDLPRIMLRVPRTADVGLHGAVQAQVGATETLDLEVSGCGATTVADVSDRFELSNDGSGSVIAGAARDVENTPAGPGRTESGAVRADAEVNTAGSGETMIASVAGSLEANVAGSGEVTVRGGALQAVNASVAGSGTVTVEGSVERLEASIAGAGDVIVRGTVRDVEASVMGSGDIVVGGVTGTQSQTVMGSGGIVVRQQNQGAAP
jgi:hypothetical protein